MALEFSLQYCGYAGDIRSTIFNIGNTDLLTIDFTDPDTIEYYHIMFDAIKQCSRKAFQPKAFTQVISR